MQKYAHLNRSVKKWGHSYTCTNQENIGQSYTVSLEKVYLGPPGFLGIWGEGLFIFRELGSTASYFRGAGEQAHTFGDLGSTVKK